jgi:hypothetical protein
VARVPIPKVCILTLEWKKQLKIKSMLNGPYVVINQLINSIGKYAHRNNSLTYILWGKKYQSNKK